MSGCRLLCLFVFFITCGAFNGEITYGPGQVRQPFGRFSGVTFFHGIKHSFLSLGMSIGLGVNMGITLSMSMSLGWYGMGMGLDKGICSEVSGTTSRFYMFTCMYTHPVLLACLT